MSKHTVSLWKKIMLIVFALISVVLLFIVIIRPEETKTIDLIGCAIPFVIGLIPYLLEWVKRGFNISYQDGKVKITETSFQNTIDETNTINGESKVD